MRWSTVTSACIAMTMVGLPALAAPAVTAPGTSNLRSGPGLQNGVIGQLPGGTEVEILDCTRDRSWCRIALRGGAAWISMTRLQIVMDGRTGERPSIAVTGGERSDTPRLVRVLGVVTDQPGRCYWQDSNGSSVIAPCPAGGAVREERRAGRVLGQVTDRPGYCYVLDASGNSVIEPCP